MRWLRRLGRTLTGRTGDRAVNDELREHVEMETQDLIARGIAPDEARRQALVALGGVDRFREEARDARGVRWLDSLRREVSYSIRSLARAPGFTFVVVLTLALGIGANTTFFSILNTLVLKPLPVREPERLVTLGGDEWTNPIWEQIRDRQDPIFESAFAWSTPASFDLSDGSQADLVDGTYVSGDLLRALGVSAERGRILTTADDARGGGPDGPVTMIGHRLWQERFGRADDVIGRRLTINRRTFTIVGVLPRSFFGLDVGRTIDVMIPLGAEAVIRGESTLLDNRLAWWLNIGGRLAPGQTIEQAQAALRAAQPPEFANDYHVTEPVELVEASTGHSSLRTRYKPALVAIMAVVGLVLLIACANVTNMLLARGTSRQREASVRLALGASRWRIASQRLVECLLLSAAGATAGIVVATWGSALVVRQLTTWREAVVLDLSPDWRVVAFLVAVTGMATLLAGLAPAWRARTSSPQDALRESGRGVVGDRKLSARNILVVAQLALSLVLLVAAGLFLRTFLGVSRVPTGMTIESLVNVDISARDVTPEERALLLERVMATVAAVPGVTSVGASAITPLSGAGWNTAVGNALVSRERQMSWLNAVSPGWFETVGSAMKEGRDFEAGDSAGVAIVNETFARRFLQPGSAVGQTFQTIGPGGGVDTFQVIGLASDVMYRAPREGMAATIFVPTASQSGLPDLLVKLAPGQYGPTTRAIADALGGVDARLSFTIRSFDDYASATTARERLTAGLAGAFGAIALVLAAVGLYGVMSYSVNRRRAEIAVRMALGADRGTISRLVIGRGTVLVLIGLIIGGVASWWAAQYVQTLLFQLDARDLTTMAGATIVLAIVGLAAAWIPAWRASRIDPAGLLRES